MTGWINMLEIISLKEWFSIVFEYLCETVLCSLFYFLGVWGLLMFYPPSPHLNKTHFLENIHCASDDTVYPYTLLQLGYIIAVIYSFLDSGLLDL